MEERIRKALKNPKIITLLIAGVLALIVGVLALLGVFSSQDTIISEDQIRIKKGNQIVTINENGLVEYRSDEGVFYETWDTNKTNAFFESMRAKARKYLANPPAEIPPNAIEITLWIDGEIVTIYVTEDDEDIGELLEEIFEEFENTDGEDITDLFDDDDDEDASSGPGSNVSPTPTGVALSGSPTPTPHQSGGTGGQTPPDCDLYGTLVTGRTVISNTICNINEN